MKREMKRWENPQLEQIGRREMRCSFYKESAEHRSLNGQWKFLYLEAPELSPEGFFEKQLEDEHWDNMDVPSVWQLKGYDNMHYTDVWYLFPIRPPFVPSNNPTGIYRKTFFLSKEDITKDIFVKFHGVDSAYDVWINGNHIGYSKVSRLSSEFDLTKYIQEGENTIVVRVYKWSDGTYLEAQDMWWYSGIYRDVELILEPKDSIVDCVVHTDFVGDDCYQDGILYVDIESKLEETSGNYHLKYGDQVVARGNFDTKETKGTIQVEVENVYKWTAETPYLYTLIVETKEHTVEVRVGFRKIELKDGNFTVNGQVILLNGVNRHDYNPKEGRTVSYEQMKQDVLMMKQYNINAVRCSHYPANEVFYDLCDEYGLYVIDEADLECHGFEWVERYDWITDDPVWEKAYKDRSIRMIKRNRNHPSILMWSMGNESSFGCNFVETAKAIKELDSSRLVHYEGDFEAEVTDVYSTMYTRLNRLEQIARYEIKGKKPHVMCEYGHAMGNGPGGLSAYQHLYRNYKRLQGGFIWEWYDHGIYTKEGDKEYYRYGGNFFDEPTNGNFCIDGLIMPDRTPSPALYEYKQVITPVVIEKIKGKQKEFRVKNFYNFLDLCHIELHFEITDGENVLEQGIVDKLSCKPQEEERIVIPYQNIEQEPNTDYYINIFVKDKRDTLYAKKDHEIAKFQFVLENAWIKREERKQGEAWKVQEEQGILNIENNQLKVAFHTVFGTLLSIEKNGTKWIEKGPEMTVYRPTIDNDMYKKEDWRNKHFLHKGSEQLDSFEYKVEEDKVTVLFHKYFGCLNQSWGFECEYEYTLYSCGQIQVHLQGKEVQNGRLEPEFLPRIGIVFHANSSLQKTIWYGRGEGENYCDSKEACIMGVYHSTIDGMATNYVYPQENGHREDVKWFSLGNETESMIFKIDGSLGLNVSNYTDEMIEQAKHPWQLQKAPFVTVHLDYVQSGLGSNSCGEEQLEPFKVKRQDFNLGYTMEIVEKGKESIYAKKHYFE